MYFWVCATTGEVVGVGGGLAVFTNEMLPVAASFTSGKIVQLFTKREELDAVHGVDKNRLWDCSSNSVRRRHPTERFPGPNRGHLYKTLFVRAALSGEFLLVTWHGRTAAKPRITHVLLSGTYVLWHAERVSRTVLYHVWIAVAVY